MGEMPAATEKSEGSEHQPRSKRRRLGEVVGLAAAVATIIALVMQIGGHYWGDGPAYGADWPTGEREFLRRLPQDLRASCAPTVRTVALVGQTAAVKCKMPGFRARTVRYDAFDAADQARPAFQYHAERALAASTGATCLTNGAEVGLWTSAGGDFSGRFACYLYGPKGVPVFVAEVRSRSATIFIADPDSSLAALQNWWSNERRRIFPDP